ncbi:uncharacterized protein [Solanum lycopersicum]|uniref:uncharacterized protein n=1 Tax=Solanum lycopersicum TaxID=4081 RepID=UPI003748B7AA
MTVHDVPLMPGDCSSLQRLSARSFHINIINLPPKVVVMVYSMMKVRPSVKMKLVNIWNNKLQAQGECTSTHDGESIEGAIMLGDALLPSACSFIVEELRQTSLCLK